mmetsp:Transcript_25788/g.36019  ORF Transcript_25788/g.36019 Transcript_25788/m.36019 type:complete len:81 (+) Transcript_25788:57-299(+)
MENISQRLKILLDVIGEQLGKDAAQHTMYDVHPRSYHRGVLIMIHAMSFLPKPFTLPVSFASKSSISLPDRRSSISLSVL